MQADLAGNDVVVDNEGGGSLLYVKDHDPQKIQRLAEGLQQSDKTNVIFVAARAVRIGGLSSAARARPRGGSRERLRWTLPINARRTTGPT